MSTEKKKKDEVLEIHDEVLYVGVNLRLICHKCGQGMKHDLAKTACEFCGHTLGMFPRVVYDKGMIPTFEVIV